MTDFRALCTELVEARDSYSYADAGDAADRMAEVVKAARTLLAQPTPPAEGDVRELVAWIHRKAVNGPDADEWRRAAELLQQRPEPVPVSERLPELRGMFERILCVARSSGQRPVGNIELADRLISAVASWAALPAPAGEVE